MLSSARRSSAAQRMRMADGAEDSEPSQRDTLAGGQSARRNVQHVQTGHCDTGSLDSPLRQPSTTHRVTLVSRQHEQV